MSAGKKNSMYRWNNIACDTIDELVALLQRAGAPLVAAKAVTVKAPDELATKIAQPANRLVAPSAEAGTPADQAKSVLGALHSVFGARMFFASRLSLAPTRKGNESEPEWLLRKACLETLSTVTTKPVTSAIAFGYVLRRLHRMNLPFSAANGRTYRLTFRPYGGQSVYQFKDLTD